MKYIMLFASLMLFGFGCTTTTPINTSSKTPDIEPDIQMTQIQDPQIYVSFIQNVHDWVFPEQSIETIRKLITLHEQYNIPVEFYLDDQTVQTYLEVDPTIFDELKSSSVVAVSYHLRPPHPAYENFDTIGISKMSFQEQYDTLLQYETHRLDMETGKYTDEPGGYALLKELISYAPRVVTHTNTQFGKALSQVYEEMGAKFTVVHGKTTALDQKIHGLQIRPEDVEVKLYEKSIKRGFDVDNDFKQWMSGFTGEQDYFINLKYHENNFYSNGTTFGPVYWSDWDTDKEQPLNAPYDLSAGLISEMKTKIEVNEKWAIYEQTLQYVVDHKDILTAITSIDLEQMLDS